MSLPTFDPGFTTTAMAAAFSPAALVAEMCVVEAALARASAEQGLFPVAVAERIAAACGSPPDADAVLAGTWEDGTPVIAMLAALRAGMAAEDGHWLHHGATTQDVVDTAMMRQAREGLQVMTRELYGLALALGTLATDHRDDPVEAWTFLQPAVPTTIGLRVAGWLSPVVTHLDDVRQVMAGLPVQLGGATGTLATLGEAGPAVVEGVAGRLGLAVPRMPWHSDRTPVRQVVGLLQQVAATMAMIATDLALLAHNGRASMRSGGSSSMPDKHNPVDAIRAIAAAEACAGVASTITRGRPHELERGVGGWHAEWFALPMTFHTAGAAVHAIRRAVDTLELIGGPVEGGPTPASGHFVDQVLADLAAFAEPGATSVGAGRDGRAAEERQP